MIMKNWSRFLAGVCCVALMACNSDDITSTNENGSEEGVYMRFRLELPKSTRSQTDTPDGGDYVTSTGGTEVGTNDENSVTGGVLVVLTTTDNKFIASQFSAGADGTEGTAASTYTVPFLETALRNQEGEEVLVYAFCNPTEDLKEQADRFNKGEILTVGGAVCQVLSPTGMEICTDKKFLMANASLAKTMLPESFSGHKTEGTAIDLGLVKVERAVARFDYKQGPVDAADGTVGESVYNVWKNDANEVLAKVQLTDMALVNMSKAFYYLRRTCLADGEGNADYQSGFTICGTETFTNYVVDTDFEDKAKFFADDNDNPINLTDHFHYSLRSFENGGKWTLNQNKNMWAWQSITGLSKVADPGNWNDAPAGTDKTGYHVWRYVTENTIPVQIRQKTGITTGIAFKGKITATEKAPDLQRAMTGGEDIYMYNNALYTLGQLQALPEGSAVQNAYKEALAEASSGKITDGNWTKHGFSVFSKSANGNYEVLYYYWNRHNDNLDNVKMGAMEFAVVRNNVYKLSVDKISAFGHPVDPGKDPDPIDPNDPDEDSDVYFKVSVQVLPWVVRVNHIVFE